MEQKVSANVQRPMLSKTILSASTPRGGEKPYISPPEAPFALSVSENPGLTGFSNLSRLPGVCPGVLNGR